MSAKTVIYGASDDLIEVDGEGLREEFTAHTDGEKQYVAFASGVLIEVHYDDDGVWRLRPLAGHYVHVAARGESAGNDEDGCPGYSDKVVIEDSGAWVVHGTAYKATK